MFVISNLSTPTPTSTGTITIVPSLTDSFTTTLQSLNPGDSVTLYSVYISTGSYWVVGSYLVVA